MKKEYNFKNARQGAIEPSTSGKTRITIRLDNDILDWFRNFVEQKGGGNYQTLINDVLCDYVDQRSGNETLEKIVRRVVRKELRKIA
jgi:uncharacterized protein (DUF4415 family)